MVCVVWECMVYVHTSLSFSYTHTTHTYFKTTLYIPDT